MLLFFFRNYETYFKKALKIRRLISEDFESVYSAGIDVLLTPTTLTTALTYNSFSQADNRTQTAQQDFLTEPANLAGKLST